MHGRFSPTVHSFSNFMSLIPYDFPSFHRDLFAFVFAVVLSFHDVFVVLLVHVSHLNFHADSVWVFIVGAFIYYPRIAFFFWLALSCRWWCCSFNSSKGSWISKVNSSSIIFWIFFLFCFCFLLYSAFLLPAHKISYSYSHKKSNISLSCIVRLSIVVPMCDFLY
jgi:hypothetical protein